MKFDSDDLVNLSQVLHNKQDKLTAEQIMTFTKDTTYAITANGNNLVLNGSDGSQSSVAVTTSATSEGSDFSSGGHGSGMSFSGNSMYMAEGLYCFYDEQDKINILKALGAEAKVFECLSYRSKNQYPDLLRWKTCPSYVESGLTKARQSYNDYREIYQDAGQLKDYPYEIVPDIPLMIYISKQSNSRGTKSNPIYTVTGNLDYDGLYGFSDR